MKKFLLSILTFVMVFSAFSLTSYAKNGSYNNDFNNITQEDIDALLYSFVAITKVNKNGDAEKIGYVYPKEFAAELPSGTNKVTYDKTSNTLTLNNYKSDDLLVLNAMGDDFKIKLIGTNEVGSIATYDSLWGGSITLTGTGSLELNKNRTFHSGLNIDVSGTKYGFFKAEKTVGFKTYGYSSKYPSMFLTGTSTAENEKIFMFNASVNKFNIIKENTNGSNSFSIYENVVMNNSKFLKLSQVKLLKAENTVDGIKISWASVNGGTSYKVYRKVGNETKWSKIATVDKLGFVDKNVKSNVKYTYTVKASNGIVDGGYDKTGKSITYLTTPTVKTANAANGVKVSWSKVSGATGYTVYSSQYNPTTKKWSSWSNRGTAKSNKSSWTDKNVKSGVQYKYAVRAVKGKELSAYKTSAVLYLSQPTVKWANNASGIKVNWSKVSGATGYTVYRSELKNGKWTGWKNMGTAKAEKSSWVDKSVVSGVTYKYTARAVNGKNLSSYQNKYSLLYLAQPTVKIANATSGIKVSWNKVGGAKGYTVYRSELKSGKWTSWKNMGTAKSTKSAWTDKSVKEGIQYKYTVRAVNGKVLSTYKATDLLMVLKMPTVTFNTSTTCINVTWSKINKATSYRVYRSEKIDGKWTSWNSIANVTTTSYSDNKLISGTEYKYTVRAVNGNSLSAYTTPASGIVFTLPTTVPDTTVPSTSVPDVTVPDTTIPPTTVPVTVI